MKLFPLPYVKWRYPMRADARRRRNAIIDAAVTTFREHGTTVALDKIAGQAGVGIATLYRNFPDKQSLIDACSAHLAGEFIHFQEDVLGKITEETAADCVRAYAERLLGMGLNTLTPALAPTYLENLPPERLKIRDILISNGDRFIALGRKYGEIGSGVTHWQFVVGLLALTRPRQVKVDIYEPNLNEKMVRIYLAGLKAGL